MNEKMVRKQIYLTGEEERGLRQLSFLKGTSQADIIREALDHYLEQGCGPASGSDERERKKGRGVPKKPLDRLVGLAGDLDAPEGLSSRHDHYIYGGEDA